MTLASLQYDLMIFSIFLLVGFIFREILPPFQKMFLPASVIGGVIALICGPQVMGLVNLPSSFSKFSGTLIDLVMTALLFGVTINGSRIRQFRTYTLIYFAFLGMQAFLGIYMGNFLTKYWPGMPEGWGLMGVYSFYGGHGAAGTVGNVFKGLGVDGNLDIGMLLATVGLIASMVIGMIIVNFGVRCGWAAYVKEPKKQPTWFYRGVLPDSEKKPIGMTTVSGNSINALALNLAILLFALWIGQGLLRNNLIPFFPLLKNVPSMLWGSIGAAILWPILCSLKVDKYFDLKNISTINGCVLEIIILTAIATIRLKLLQTYFVPLMIYSFVVIGATIILLYFLCRHFFADQWFENFVMLYGRGTGVAANGLALVRTIDPDSQCNVGAADGVATAVYAPLSLMIGVWPAMLLAHKLWESIGIGIAIFLIPIILLFLFDKKR